MCAVCVIYDTFGKLPDTWWNTQDRITTFYTVLDQARILDALTGAPDCEDPEKAKLLERVEELEKQLADKE